MKGIHARIKPKQNKDVNCAQGKRTISGIIPERVKNSQRMTLRWDSAQRDLKAQLQDPDSARCWGTCVTLARRCFAKQGKGENVIQPES